MESNVPPQAGSQILSKILSPAIRFWLRSQVESAAALEFQVSGRDRQILRGWISTVQVTATQVVYQGLHLSQAQLKASQIRINLNQVVQGKPLRLLEIVPVFGEIQLTQADLTASSESPLLHQGLTDILQNILRNLLESLAVPELAGLSIQDMTLKAPHLILKSGQITVRTEVVSPVANSPDLLCWHLLLQTAPRLVTPSQLQLADLTIEITRLNQAASKQILPPFEIDLGQEVNLQQLEITPTQIICIGQVNVVPA